MNIQNAFTHMVNDIVDYLWLRGFKPGNTEIEENNLMIPWYDGLTRHSIRVFYFHWNNQFVLINYTNHVKIEQYVIDDLDNIYDQIILIINRIKPPRMY